MGTKNSNISKILQTEPNITPPFKISIVHYASKTKKAHQGNLLNSQLAPKWLQKYHTHAT